jgi:hypothetical protein
MASIVMTDDDLSQFLAFTGTSDPDVARRYLEMAGNNLETAVGLFVDHDNASAMGGGGGLLSSSSSEYRARRRRRRGR